MKNQAYPSTHAQSGSVLVIILIGIVLFAALSYAMSKGTGSGLNIVNSSKTDLMATEMITYGQQVQAAVRNLMINGCTDSMISFETPETAAVKTYSTNISVYNNASAPTDKRCHVFYPNGGGLNFAVIPYEARVAGYTAAANTYRDEFRYYFGGTINFAQDTDAGTLGDLAMFATHITTELCDAINQKLGIGSSVSVPLVPINSNMPYYNDTMYANFLMIGTSTSASLMAKRMGCIKATDPQDNAGFSGGNTFYTVLYMRK